MQTPQEADDLLTAEYARLLERARDEIEEARSQLRELPRDLHALDAATAQADSALQTIRLISALAHSYNQAHQCPTPAKTTGA